MNEQPMKEFRAGTAVASIWPENPTANGQTIQRFSIRVQKRYRDDKSGLWKTTTYFRPDELPKLALVVSRAYEFLTLRETDEPTATSS